MPSIVPWRETLDANVKVHEEAYGRVADGINLSVSYVIAQQSLDVEPANGIVTNALFEEMNELSD